MDWISKIDWAAIIREAASSNLGTIALSLLVFGVVVIVLFRNEENSKAKLIALFLLMLGVLSFALVIGRETVDEIERQRLADEKAALILQCREEVVLVEDSCRAYDRSGFESSPSASCELDLTAPQGFFFVDSEVEVVSEYYRNISGAPAQNAVKAEAFYESAESDIRLPIRFVGRIGCTNARGTGRTCESMATIQASAFPEICISVARDIRR